MNSIRHLGIAFSSRAGVRLSKIMKRLLLPALLAALPTVALGSWVITDFDAFNSGTGLGYSLIDETNNGVPVTDTESGPIVGVANYYPPGLPVNFLSSRTSSVTKQSGAGSLDAALKNETGELFWSNEAGLMSTASVTYNYNTALNFNSLGDRLTIDHTFSDGINFTLQFNINGGSGSGGATISNNYATFLDLPLERSWLYSSAVGNLAAFNAVTSLEIRLVSILGGADNTFDNFRLTGVAAVPEPGTTAAVVALLLGAGVHGYRRVRAAKK